MLEKEVEESKLIQPEKPKLGFTVYDSQSLNEILDFGKDQLLEKYNMIIKRQITEVNHIACLFKTSNYAIVFEDNPNRVEFYDIDLI
jgi:hypothetical protein